MALPALWDDSGRPVALASRLGRGGEGNVYALAGGSGLAAKIYHHAPDALHAAKLAAMLHSPTTATLGAVAAWPVGLVYETPRQLRGLLMPRVAGRPIHVLYGPKSRLVAFPEAGWDFLVGAAANLAQAVAAVHAAGQVVGDLNHANALVDALGVVRLIDCDSFQIHDAAHVFPCEVGVGTHLAPELQGQERGVVRTANHDAFALAVLLFQLLFVGRHPFSGRHAEDGDLPLEDAIRGFRFAYGAAAASRRMRPPPLVPALDVASPAIAALFERAFAPAGAENEGRPSAATWAAALGALPARLSTCGEVPAHRFWAGLSTCAWCATERRSGAWLFPAPPGAGSGRFDLRRIWTEILSVPEPGPAPLLPPSPRVPASPWARRAQLQRTVARAVFVGLLIGVSASGVALLEGAGGFALLLAVVVFGGGMGVVTDLIWGRRLTSDARRRLEQIDFDLQPLETRWREEAGPQAFDQRRAALESARRQYVELQPDAACVHRQPLERELTSGGESLGRLARRAHLLRVRLPGPLRALRDQRAQAEADLRILNG